MWITKNCFEIATLRDCARRTDTLFLENFRRKVGHTRAEGSMNKG